MQENYDPGWLRWQCRRGIKEVEVVLLPYLETRFASASAHEQSLFVRLLTCHDVDLLEWVMRRDQPDDPGLAEMMKVIIGDVAS